MDFMFQSIYALAQTHPLDNLVLAPKFCKSHLGRGFPGCNVILDKQKI